MPYRLRMPAQIGDWLAELAASAPEAAAETVAALLVLMRADAIPGPPLVGRPDEPAHDMQADPEEAGDPRGALDRAYQQLLQALQHVRREVADVATGRKRTEFQLDTLELDPALRPVLERQLAATWQLESALAQRGHRLRLLVDRFRTDKETAKALATAAEVEVRLRAVIAALDTMPDDGDTGSAHKDSADFHGAGSDRADLDSTVRDAVARLEEVLADARRLLALVPDTAGDARQAPATGPRSRLRPEVDVRELLGDPLGSCARLLFAEEPTGTITVLAVLEDAHAVAELGPDASDLAAGLLEEIRDEGWPTEYLDFAAPESLAGRYFPGREEDVAARATRLSRTLTLARLRERADVTVAEVSGRAGLSAAHIADLERHGIRPAQVGWLADYARALGGTLRLSVDLDGTEHPIL